MKSIKTVVALLLAIGALHSGSVFAQWEWLNPVPESSEFFAAAAVSDQVVWFAGENGSIVYTTDGGTSWKHSQNPLRGTPFICLSFIAIDNQTAVIAANNGAILRTYNAGTAWEILSSPSKPVQRLRRAPDGSIWGYGSNGSIARSTNAGTSWTQFNTGINTVVFDIDFPEPGKAVAACGQGAFLVSTDNGQTWTPNQLAGTEDCISIDFVSPSQGFALQNAKKLLKTTDGGQTWADTSFSTNQMRQVRFFDELNGWIVTNSIGNVYSTSNGGVTWQLRTVDPSTRYTFQGCLPLSAQTCVMFGIGGGMFITQDGGLTWDQQDAGFSRQHLYGITGLSEQQAWIFGYRSAYATTDAGASWTPNLAPNDTSFHTGYAISATRLIGGGSQGQLYLSTDAGQTWTLVTTLTNAGLIEEFDFVNDQVGWAVGYHGTVGRTTDGGASWESLDPGVTHDFHGISARSTLEAWVAGDGGNIYFTTDGGVNWNQRASGVTSRLRTIRFVNNTEAWTGGELTLLHSTDGGQTWTKKQNTGIDVLYKIHFTNDQTGYFMTSRSILRTSDGGSTFYRTDYPASGLRALDPLPNGYAWLAGDFGATLRYTPAPVVSVVPAYIDFGDVPTNKTEKRTFEVRSVGEVPLNVIDIPVQGAGYSLYEGASGILAPGEKDTVTIEFAPTDTIRMRGIATVASNAVMGFPIVELVGDGIPPLPAALTHSPAEVDFGSVRLGDLKDGTAEIVNKGSDFLLIRDVVFSGSDSANFLVTSPPSGAMARNDTETIGLLFVPKKMGQLSSILYILSSDQGVPKYPIPVKGFGQNPTITPARDTVNFGFVYEPNAGYELLTITNTGNVALKINSWSIHGPDSADFEIVQAPATDISVNGTTQIRLKFLAASPYTWREARLELTTDDYFNYTKNIVLLARPTSTGIESPGAAGSFALLPAYPNPFSASIHGSTAISFELESQANVDISVYDILGKTVGTLTQDRFEPGLHSVPFSSAGLRPGTYIVQMKVAGTKTASIQRIRAVLTK